MFPCFLADNRILMDFDQINFIYKLQLAEREKKSVFNSTTTFSGIVAENWK